jgi:mannosylglycerate hydrolase
MKAENIIIVPETHWDREWYISFQEFRARLVIMMDKLLDILRNDPHYKNFTLDGQTIPIEDYLEVRPENEEDIKKFVKQGRLSIGPMYVLPDEFLISGESLIRNFVIGHQIAQKFGKVMKVAYIPDPFGHIAQLPQIVYEFDIPAIIFERGFGNEFEENNLTMEFIWETPGKVAAVLGIHLIRGYGSLEVINTSLEEGIYKKAIEKIRRVTSDLEQFTGTPIVLLNNGSDHREAYPEIPEIVRQWNEMHPDILLEQNDFEYYINKILKLNPKLNHYQGELRGSKYSNLLSGVFSARMWIKQRNTKIEYLFEKYCEPISSITWCLDKYHKFSYPNEYIKVGYKWLIKNHPHDSICGCSIDQVHEEMRTRFDWSEQIGNEIIKLAFLYLSDLIKFKPHEKDRIPLIILNPLPWRRKDIVSFNAICTSKKKGDFFPENFKLIDTDDREIEFQGSEVEEKSRFMTEASISYQFTFLADVPACGFNVYYVILGEKAKEIECKKNNFKITKNSIENEFYKVKVKDDGQIDIYNKESKVLYESVCFLEDMGDWGDEYDFSGPYRSQVDIPYSTKDAKILNIFPYLDGYSHKILKIEMILNLPVSLKEDRLARAEELVENKIDLYISLLKGINRIDFKIELENNSKDHRIRVLFPSKIVSDRIYCDGQFYVIPRNIKLAKNKRWIQKPLPTNHQKDFIAINDDLKCYAVLNRGLPEYEAIKSSNNSIILAITLLRCVGWLSRSKIASRKMDAGPPLSTPGAQCLGKHSFELSLVIENNIPHWIDADIHLKAKEFNSPLKPIFPFMLKSPLRCADRLLLTYFGVLSILNKPPMKEKEPYLPSKFSFLEIDNKKIMMSILKKSEKSNCLIIRLYNLSSKPERTKLTFFEGFFIQDVGIVNLLEEEPRSEIDVKIDQYLKNKVTVILGPHIIATIKIHFKKTI